MVNEQKIFPFVDDDENIAELISLYLAKECFDTMMVHDGEKRLIAYDTYHPNLILLDLMLPESTATRSAANFVPGPTCRLSCCPPRAKSLIRYWDWNSAPTTI